MNINYFSADNISTISIFQKHKNMKLDSILVLAKNNPDIIEIRFTTDTYDIVTLTYSSFARATEFLNAALSASWFRIILPTDKVDIGNGKKSITITSDAGIPITYHDNYRNGGVYDPMLPWMDPVFKPIHMYGYTFLYWKNHCTTFKDVDGRVHELMPWNVCFPEEQKEEQEEPLPFIFGSGSQGKSILYELLSFWEDKGTIKEKKYEHENESESESESEEEFESESESESEESEEEFYEWVLDKNMFSGQVSDDLYIRVDYKYVLSIRKKGRRILIEEEDEIRSYRLDTEDDCDNLFNCLVSGLTEYRTSS